MHFTFQIITPEALVFEGSCSEIELPGKEGRFGVLAKHMNMVSALKPGVVIAHSAEAGKTVKFIVSGGFADVTPESCTLLVEMAIEQSKIDIDIAKHRIEELNNVIKQDISEREKGNYALEIEYLEQILSLHKH
jgi:F-type H+-transporting ATPase subunit epsilon